MSKVSFTSNDSVLRQWEQMHRPNEEVPPEGPAKLQRAGLIVPMPPKGAPGGRSHSLLTSTRDVTAFPIRTNDTQSVSRRPSDLWLGKLIIEVLGFLLKS